MGKYKERRSKTAEEQKAEQLNDQMQDDKAQLEADIRANERASRQAASEEQKALCASPFNALKVIEARDKKEFHAKIVEQMKTMLAEEFGE